MPQWAGSSWYFLRYIDPKNNAALADPEKLKYWGPVDWYNGGMEHVTRHLIYSRFWNQFLFDIGAVPFREAYTKRTAQGLILGEDGQKMSKSIGNVVSPDDIVIKDGADVLRLYIMFMGDYESAVPWSNRAISGAKRFLDRVYNMTEFMKSGEVKNKPRINRLIKKVSEDIEGMKYNTAIAAMMAFINEIYDEKHITKEEFNIFLSLLYPFAPHIAEEVNEQLGFPPLFKSKWHKFNENELLDDIIELPVQVNGKLRAVIKISKDAEESEVLNAALEQLGTENMNIKKKIYVKGKILSLIV
jgi:leucyl-tRNA synthetase